MRVGVLLVYFYHKEGAEASSKLPPNVTIMLQATHQPRLFLENRRFIIGMQIFQLQLRCVRHGCIIHAGV